MAEVSTFLVLLCLVTFLAFLTRNWSIPYPTVMVFVGGGIALIPGLPNVGLTPDVVFLIFLPPLLYAAAWQTPIHDFRKNIRAISLPTIGLVLMTTICVGITLIGFSRSFRGRRRLRWGQLSRRWTRSQQPQ